MTSAAQRRLLVLAPFPPRLDGSHGGSRALAELLLAHARVSPIALVSLRGPEDEGVDDSVADACELVREVRRVPIGGSPATAWRERRRAVVLARTGSVWAASVASRELAGSVADLVRDWRPSVVQAEFRPMGPYLAQVGRGIGRVVVDHDAAPASPGAAAVWRWRREARFELQAADAVVVFTDADIALTRSVAPAGSLLEAIPFPWPRSGRDVRTGEPGSVLFVGNFAHGPNVEAARRLVRLLPELRRRRPDAVLTLVGDRPPRELAGEGVVLAGRVASVEPLLEAAAVVAAPVTRGGGVRVKVLEALAAGKAVVGTSLAFEGLGVEKGLHAVVADDDAALLDAIDALLGDPRRREELGRAAQALLARMPGPDEVAQRYDALYRRLESVSVLLS